MTLPSSRSATRAPARLGATVLLLAAVGGGVHHVRGNRGPLDLEVRVSPAARPRTVDVDILQDGAVVRSAALPLAPGQDRVAHSVELRQGSYTLRALVQGSARTLSSTAPASVPGALAVVTLADTRPEAP
jgi:hypothetical protein